MIHRSSLLAFAVCALCLGACAHSSDTSSGTTAAQTPAPAQTPTPAKPVAVAPAPAPAMPAAPVVVYIDDLDLTKVKQQWGDPGKNLSADGNPVTLNSKTFTHALGSHADSVFVINVKGAAKNFTATVGVDDDADQSGSVRFLVIGDGKTLTQTDFMHSGQSAKQLSVDLTGVSQLVLKIEPASDNIDYDHGDWADAKITLDPAKAAEKPEAVDSSLEKPAK